MSRPIGSALLALVLAGCHVVQGNGERVERTFQPGAFHGVQITHGVQATYTVGEPGTVVLAGDSNLLDLLDVRIEDGEMIVAVKDSVLGSIFHATEPITLTFSAPTLKSIRASGGSKFSATSVLSEGRLTLGASGGSTLSLGTVTATKLDVELSGGSRLEAAGTADELVASFSGGSRGDAEELSVRHAKFSLSGGSEITVAVSETIEGAASGGSHIFIVGQPSGDVSRSGGSTITFD